MSVWLSVCPSVCYMVTRLLTFLRTLVLVTAGSTTSHTKDGPQPVNRKDKNKTCYIHDRFVLNDGLLCCVVEHLRSILSLFSIFKDENFVHKCLSRRSGNDSVVNFQISFVTMWTWLALKTLETMRCMICEIVGVKLANNFCMCEDLNIRRW